MEITCGVDIIEVKRIEEAISTLGKKFVQRIFTEEEIQYCEQKKKMKYQHYAARFAAKEAVYKAISSKIKNEPEGIWKNIEVRKNREGRPYIHLKHIEVEKIKSIDISLSHLKEYAIANCTILFQEEEK